MTRILITGASGFLGHNLAARLAPRHEVFAGFCNNPPDPGTGMPVRLDVTDAEAALRQVGQVSPALVIHSAALSQPDECERRPEAALGVIVSGTRNIAEACSRVSARLVHISTDLVFDGERGWYTEEDPVRGISVYSRSKIEAERAALATLPSSVILRVALLFGVGSRSHAGSVAAIIRAWREGRAQTFYTDQFRTPISAAQVADAVERLLVHPEVSGVFHLGGAQRVSRFEFAVSLAKRAAVPPDLVRPGSMREARFPAARGADCSLVSDRIRAALDFEPLACSEALDLMEREGLLSRI